MKKSLLFLLVISVLLINPANSQGLLNKVKSAVSKEISGNKTNSAGQGSSKTAPEPKCACENPELVVGLDNNKILYNEMSVFMKDDGSLLIWNKAENKYYIAKNGKTEGPYSSEDKIVTDFKALAGGDQESDDNEKDSDFWFAKYPSYISRSGEKYLIKFNGKSYGPYALISEFVVPASKDKFAAMVTENMAMTKAQGKKMEEAMKNAKTDQERMELSMKYSQMMTQNVMDGGGASSILPKLVTSIPGALSDDETQQTMGWKLNGTAKYDDIVFIAPNGIFDLKGKQLLNVPYGLEESENFFVSSTNDRYASYNYGTLTFSDKSTLAQLFSPCLTKKDGKVYIAYLYYSPSRNAIMRCYIPF